MIIVQFTNTGKTKAFSSKQAFMDFRCKHGITSCDFIIIAE